MRYTKLGRTGIDCSRLGFGTWQIGGGRWKGMGRAESVTLLRHALECGVNTFDAAVVYGQYHGEVNERRSRALELLGEALDGRRRNEAIVCLKLGQLDEYSHRAIYEPRNMVMELQRSLRELRMEYVDVCLVHAPTLHEVREGRALAVIQTIREMGAARFVGYSFEAEPDHAKIALTQGIDVLMLQYNLLDQDCAEVFSVADEQGVGMLIGGPFKRGYLSGQFETLEDLPSEDNYWEWNLRYAPEKVMAILKKAVELKRKAGGARDLRKMALHHILRHVSATSAIVGHRTKEEVVDNAKTIDEIFAT